MSENKQDASASDKSAGQSDVLTSSLTSSDDTISRDGQVSSARDAGSDAEPAGLPRFDRPEFTDAREAETTAADLPVVEGDTESSAAEEVAAGGATASRPVVRRTRKARLRVSRIDPWSVMKTAFLFSIAGGIIFWVGTYVVWGVIEASGLFDSINKVAGELVNQPGSTEVFRVQDYISANKVLGLAALLAAVDIVLLTALATLGSFLYNLSATVLGGLEVTLAED